MESFYVILFVEVGFSLLMIVVIYFFVTRTNKASLEEKQAHLEAEAKSEKEVSILENLVKVQEKVLKEYRSTKL